MLYIVLWHFSNHSSECSFSWNQSIQYSLIVVVYKQVPIAIHWKIEMDRKERTGERRQQIYLVWGVLDVSIAFGSHKWYIWKITCLMCDSNILWFQSDLQWWTTFLLLFMRGFFLHHRCNGIQANEKHSHTCIFIIYFHCSGQSFIPKVEKAQEFHTINNNHVRLSCDNDWKWHSDKMMSIEMLPIRVIRQH